MAYYDEDGQEVDGLLTEEEATKKIDEAKAEQQKAFEAQQAESTQKIDTLNKSLEDTKAKIEAAEDAGEGSDDKDKNLANLRNKLKETEAALESEKKANEERWNTVQADKVAAAIKQAAGNDEELAKKIEHEYSTTLSGVNALTAEEISKKVASAAKLAGGPVDTPSPLDIAAGGGSRGIGSSGIANPGGGKPITEQDKQFGQKLGLSPDDYKKYEKDPRRSK